MRFFEGGRIAVGKATLAYRNTLVLLLFCARLIKAASGNICQIFSFSEDRAPSIVTRETRVKG